jgi:predicted DNA-binding transcriptional regulator YafY
MKMAEEQGRYTKLQNILKLITTMQARSYGITLNDIQKEAEVSRRTAERLRDVLLSELPIDELENFHGKEKHWGFRRSGYLKEIISFSKEEIAELENIKNAITVDNQKETLTEIITKIKALSGKNVAQIEDAIEILLKTEGVAVSQNPNYKIDVKSLELIRQSIKENRRIKCKYDGRDKILSPYGIVYGENVFLIAVEGDWENPYVYRLHRISDIELTCEKFDKGDFDIKKYANRSFGVYQNEEIKVELLFSPAVAEDVLNFNFHPTQKVRQNDDGTVTVKFRASGDLQILWHVFKWGEDVKIISPNSLRKQYIEYLESVINRQKR